MSSIIFGTVTTSQPPPPNPTAAYDLAGIVSVGATNTTDGLADFSNHGAASVDLLAPGVDIASTYIGGTRSYSTGSGTSMSAPLVAGAAALLWAHNPGLSAAQV